MHGGQQDRALGIDPRFPDAYWERGRAFAAKHDQGRAVADFNQAIKINANYADPYNGRGLIHHQRGEFDAAIADFSEAKQLVWVFPPLSPIRGFDRRNKRRETWAGRGAPVGYRLCRQAADRGLIAQK